MAGQKRSRSGEPKVQSKPSPEQPHDITMTDTPPYGQALPPLKKANTEPNKPTKAQAKTPRVKAVPYNPPTLQTHNLTTATTPSPTSAPLKNTTSKHTHHTATTSTKRPRLPPTAKITKRPLLHPAIPTPFASASHPKVLYITRSSPFIPSCKRIRSLLVQIGKRATQSTTENRGRGKARGRRLEANGRLSAQDVEASIALASAGRREKGGSGLGLGGEEVYLKATGRAIPRALELGVKFQAEEDCRVRVEMGSVKAIDDVEVAAGAGAEGEGSRGEEVEEEEEVPETRIRTLSTVTVCIGLV